MQMWKRSFKANFRSRHCVQMFLVPRSFLGSACFFKHDVAFAKGAPNPWNILEKDGNVSNLLSCFARSILLPQGGEGQRDVCTRA